MQIPNLFFFHFYYFLREKHAQKKINIQTQTATAMLRDDFIHLFPLKPSRKAPPCHTRTCPETSGPGLMPGASSLPCSSVPRGSLCQTAARAGHRGRQGIPSHGQHWQGGTQPSGQFLECFSPGRALALHLANCRRKLSGKNVTVIPLKMAVCKCLGGDEASPLASKGSGDAATMGALKLGKNLGFF